MNYRKNLTKIVVLAALTGSCAQAFAQEEKAASGEGGMTSDRIARVQGQNTSLVKQPVKTERKRETPKHLVEAGDTLWDLSSEYLSDPFMWPALWSYNPQVTNPHWIYPGDTIYLEPHSDEGAALTTAPAQPVEMHQEVRHFVSRATVPGFYVAELPETCGHILYSDQEKHMIAPGDEVQVDWVDIEMRKKVSNGQRFTVFSQSRPVKNEDGDDMAYKLIRQGVIEIVDKRDDSLSTARVVQATREIERGMLILPDESLVYTLERKPNARSMEGRIIDTIDIITQVASDQFVIINRGSQDGVMEGNRWVIFEQREGLNLLEKGEETRTVYADKGQQARKDGDDGKDLRDGEISRPDEQSWVLGHEVEMHIFPEREDLDDIYGDREYTTSDLPLRKIGDILVVDVRDKFSTGVIMNSSREVGIDTRIVMIKGE